MIAVVYITGIIFIVILIALHFIKPEFDPSWRMISEYEIGKNGWLMRVAFFIWAACIASFTITLIQASVKPHYVIDIWLFIISIAMIGAGIFRTDPIDASTNSLNDVMHKVFGSIVILTFPIIGTIITVTYISQEAVRMKVLLIIATTLIWVGQVCFFGVTAIAQRKNPNIKQGSPEIKIGWPNRIMVLSYVIWIFIAVACIVK
jgi:hypothetical protein